MVEDSSSCLLPVSGLRVGYTLRTVLGAHLPELQTAIYLVLVLIIDENCGPDFHLKYMEHKTCASTLDLDIQRALD